MSVSENVIQMIQPREYTPEKGRFTAEQFADGQTLRQLAGAFPDYLPPAMYIKQWRKEYPAFDQLMVIASAALADVKIEEAEDVAEDMNRPAAHAANTIKIKMAQAAALDSQVYGNKRIIAGDKDNPLTVRSLPAMTDDELMTIARGGVVHIDGKTGAETALAPPAPPLVRGGRDSIREVRDTKIPTLTSQEPSVTTIKPAEEPVHMPPETESEESVIVDPVPRVDAIDPGF